ncbi:hypothetical protein GGX14DRAFT_383841 [Mycena pura]|uniref:Uncharacterized protein n=1 Tax=Mycena pura TaxID=153505 RepID=A0AAD6YU41_9AGAR|nr:hypothetical protein GGX14DRAFT_383841 [Mycena pura]
MFTIVVQTKCRRQGKKYDWVLIPKIAHCRLIRLEWYRKIGAIPYYRGGFCDCETHHHIFAKPAHSTASFAPGPLCSAARRVHGSHQMSGPIRVSDHGGCSASPEAPEFPNGLLTNREICPNFQQTSKMGKTY